MNILSRGEKQSHRILGDCLGHSSLSIMVLLVFILSGCTDKNAYKKVDISNVKADIEILRLEQDLVSLTAENYEEKQNQLTRKYGDFYPFYLNQIMRFGKPRFENDTEVHSLKEDVLGFINDTIIRLTYDDTQNLYAKDFPEKKLEKAIRHFQFYFPEYSINNVITFISGFQYGASTFDSSTLAIGLDMYLGSDHPAYQNIEIPNYIAQKLNSDFIVPNSMEAIYQLYFDNTAYNAELPLLEAMVNEGKKYYFLECMLPDAPDSLIIGYTAKQLTWCKNSEKQIWQFFNEKDLLYKTNFMEQKRYLSEAPSTNGMPQEAPGKVGAWVGWQIVRKFMRETDGQISLAELVTEKQPKEIIAKARYKP